MMMLMMMMDLLILRLCHAIIHTRSFVVCARNKHTSDGPSRRAERAYQLSCLPRVALRLAEEPSCVWAPSCSKVVYSLCTSFMARERTDAPPPQVHFWQHASQS